MSESGQARWVKGFKADYTLLFVSKWSSYMGVVLLVLVILGLMINGMVWGVFGGVKFWGDWINNLIGLGPVLGVPEHLDGFLTHRMSLMNTTLVLGAFCAALMSLQFAPSRPPKLEYVWAIVGVVISVSFILSPQSVQDQPQ